MKTIMVSPMQDIPPPPCPVASTPKPQLARSEAAPALQLLLGKIIIEKSAIALLSRNSACLAGPSRSLKRQRW